MEFTWAGIHSRQTDSCVYNDVRRQSHDSLFLRACIKIAKRNVKTMIAGLQRFTTLALGCVLVVWGLYSGASTCSANQAEAVPSDRSKPGVLIDLTMPLDAGRVAQVIASLKAVSQQYSDRPADRERTTVVLNYDTTQGNGSTTQFEDALKLARFFFQPDMRSLKIVAFVNGEIQCHALLPIIASDSLIVGPSAVLGSAVGDDESAAADETIPISYTAIAARRGLFPTEVVQAMCDSRLELILATTVEGQRKFYVGEQVADLRKLGGGWQEETWASANSPIRLTAARLRSALIATHQEKSLEDVQRVLGLSSLEPAGQVATEALVAGLMEIKGAISKDRIHRWQLNLAKALDAQEIQAVVADIDCAGGDLNESILLAGTLATRQPPLQQSIAFIRGQARGDAVLLALACKPLYMHAEAKLGGPGNQAIDAAALTLVEPAIEQIAKDTGRPLTLMKGLLDPSRSIYRFVHVRSGQVLYAEQADDQPATDPAIAEDPAAWKRQDRIDLSKGLTTSEAAELGLCEGQADSIEDVSTKSNLAAVPQPIVDRGLVHFVEWIGGMKGVSVFLLMVGLVTLSMEAGAPGISLPGFISLLCFSLYFWIQFLNGTAQWLEVLAFALGIVCIGIEIFLLPGIGVFGIGGLCLLVLGVILTSQTFIIPRNTYQFEQLTHNLWLLIGAFAAVVVGFVMLRILVPQQTLFKHLALDGPDPDVIEDAERLAKFDHLRGMTGKTTTALLPAGKAMFGDEVVQVLSDGSPISAGTTIQVVEVKGNRIVVSELA